MTYDYEGYDLKFIQIERCNDGLGHYCTYIYKFYSPITTYTYILKADLHKEDVFAVKFYRKQDKRSDYKYNHIVNKGDVGNIVITCLSVIPILLKQFPNASFCFLASPSIDERKKVEPIRNNQRFKLYMDVVNKRIGNKTFTVLTDENISGCLLLNNKEPNPKTKLKKIKEMFVRTYNNMSLI